MYQLRAKVESNEVVIIEQQVKLTENSLNTIGINFELPQEYEGLTTIAVFKIDDKAYKRTIIDNEVIIPRDVLVECSRILLGVYAYEEDNLIYSPKPIGINVHMGSYVEESESEKAFEISEYDTYMEKAQKMYLEIKELSQEEMAKIQEYGDGLLEDITSAKDEAITQINNKIPSIIEEIDIAKDDVLIEITSAKQQSIDQIDSEVVKRLKDTLGTIRIDPTTGKMYVSIKGGV